MGRLFQQAQDAQVFTAQEPLVFDRQQFEASTMYDLSLQREILGMFFGQLDQVVERLSEGPLTPDESKFMGHTLRGAAAAMGAVEIQKLAADWENQLQELGRLVLKLTEAKSSFRKSVTRYFPQVELQ